VPVGDPRIRPLSAGASGARQADVPPAPQAIPTAMK